MQSGKVIFEIDLRVNEALAVNEVEVKVEYAGLNKEGIVVINGSDYPSSFSHEIYGKVTSVGSGVENLHPGDNVFGFSFDKFATFQRTPSNLVQKADEKDSPKELATLPLAYCAALYGLGSLEENDIVLILHGTGACGLAALSVCHWRKAKPSIVVESQAEADKIKIEYDLSEKQVIFSSVKSIPARLSELTKGHGADVVFMDPVTVTLPTSAGEESLHLAVSSILDERIFSSEASSTASHCIAEPATIRLTYLTFIYRSLKLSQSCSVCHMRSMVNN